MSDEESDIPAKLEEDPDNNVKAEISDDVNFHTLNLH